MDGLLPVDTPSIDVEQPLFYHGPCLPFVGASVEGFTLLCCASALDLVVAVDRQQENSVAVYRGGTLVESCAAGSQAADLQPLCRLSVAAKPTILSTNRDDDGGGSSAALLCIVELDGHVEVFDLEEASAGRQSKMYSTVFDDEEVVESRWSSSSSIVCLCSSGRVFLVDPVKGDTMAVTEPCRSGFVPVCIGVNRQSPDIVLLGSRPDDENAASGSNLWAVDLSTSDSWPVYFDDSLPDAYQYELTESWVHGLRHLHGLDGPPQFAGLFVLESAEEEDEQEEDGGQVRYETLQVVFSMSEDYRAATLVAVAKDELMIEAEEEMEDHITMHSIWLPDWQLLMMGCSLSADVALMTCHEGQLERAALPATIPSGWAALTPPEGKKIGCPTDQVTQDETSLRSLGLLSSFKGEVARKDGPALSSPLVVLLAASNGTLTIEYIDHFLERPREALEQPKGKVAPKPSSTGSSGSQATPSPFSASGAAPTASPFGGSSTATGSSLFGSSATTGSSPFGGSFAATGSSLFGGSSAATGPSPFGGSSAATGSSPFGSSAATGSSPFGGSGAASGSSPFGSSSAATGSSPFGSSAATGSSPFGGSGAASSSSLFGSSAASGSSPFGGAATGSSPFGGSSAASSSSPFGGGGAAPSSGPFGGSSAPSPSPFGSSPSTGASGTSPFGPATASAPEATTPQPSLGDAAGKQQPDQAEGPGPAGSGGSRLADEVKERIEAIYREHNTSKLGEVPNILVKYQGREAELYLKVCSKYKVAPTPLPIFSSEPQVSTGGATTAPTSGSGAAPSPSTGGSGVEPTSTLFGGSGTEPSSSLFGGSSAARGSGLFGGSSVPSSSAAGSGAESSSGLFGGNGAAPSSGLFGGSSAPSAFSGSGAESSSGFFGGIGAAPSSGLFGGSGAPSSSSGSGAESSSGLFGGNGAAPGSGLLGGGSAPSSSSGSSAEPSSGFFGGNGAAPSSGLFGGSSAPSSSSSAEPSSGLFGGNGAAPSSGLFGGSSAPSSGSGGSAEPSSGLFGIKGAAPSSSLFGGASTASPSPLGGSLFGISPGTSAADQDKAASTPLPSGDKAPAADQKPLSTSKPSPSKAAAPAPGASGATPEAKGVGSTPAPAISSSFLGEGSKPPQPAPAPKATAVPPKLSAIEEAKKVLAAIQSSAAAGQKVLGSLVSSFKQFEDALSQVEGEEIVVEQAAAGAGSTTKELNLIAEECGKMEAVLQGLSALDRPKLLGDILEMHQETSQLYSGFLGTRSCMQPVFGTEPMKERCSELQSRISDLEEVVLDKFQNKVDQESLDSIIAARRSQSGSSMPQPAPSSPQDPGTVVDEESGFVVVQPLELPKTSPPRVPDRPLPRFSSKLPNPLRTKRTPVAELGSLFEASPVFKAIGSSPSRTPLSARGQSDNMLWFYQSETRSERRRVQELQERIVALSDRAHAVVAAAAHEETADVLNRFAATGTLPVAAESAHRGRQALYAQMRTLATNKPRRRVKRVDIVPALKFLDGEVRPQTEIDTPTFGSRAAAFDPPMHGREKSSDDEGQKEADRQKMPPPTFAPPTKAKVGSKFPVTPSDADSPVPQAAPSAGLFGGSTSAAGSSLFGGSSAAPSSGLFGGSGTAPSSSPFGGTSTPSPSAFGSAPSSGASGASLFGSVTAPAQGAATSGGASGAGLFGSATAPAQGAATSGGASGASLFGSATAPAQGAATPQSSQGGVGGASLADEARQRIEAIYRDHNPGKLGEVPNILVKYQGRESELYLKVCNKYNVTPQPLPTSSPAPQAEPPATSSPTPQAEPPSTPAPQAAPSAGLFGGSASASSSGLFGGSSAAPSSGLFGGSGTAPSSSPFGGTSTPSPSAFGSAPSSGASGASLFGSVTAPAQGAATSGGASGAGLFGSATAPAQGAATPQPFQGAGMGLQQGVGGSNVADEARQRIEAIYRQHNPGKLGEVPNILVKYQGRESELYLKVCSKYKVQPQPFTGASPGLQAAPSSSAFGGTAAPSSAPFGGTSPAPSSGLFGGGGAAPSASPFGGGGAVPSSSPFGGSGPAPKNSSPFGGVAAPSSAPFGNGGAAPGSGLFGGGGAAPSSSPFGGAPSSSPFGGGGAAPSSSPFGGAATPSPSAFGSSPFGGAPGASAFGSAPGASPQPFMGGGMGLQQGMGGSNVADEARQRIEAIYRQHNPGKLGEVPSILAKYQGREPELYLKVCSKYKVPPQPFAGVPQGLQAAPGGFGGSPTPFGGSTSPAFGAPSALGGGFGGSPFGGAQGASPFGGSPAASPFGSAAGGGTAMPFGASMPQGGGFGALAPQGGGFGALAAQSMAQGGGVWQYRG